MTLDVASLTGVEDSRLVEDRLVDPDLADVVQVGTACQRSQVVGAQPHPAAESGGQLGRPTAVPVGVGVLGLHRADQRPERLRVAALDVDDRAVVERIGDRVDHRPVAPGRDRDAHDGPHEPGEQVAVVVPPGQMEQLPEAQARDGRCDHRGCAGE